MNSKSIIEKVHRILASARSGIIQRRTKRHGHSVHISGNDGQIVVGGNIIHVTIVQCQDGNK